MKRDLETMMKRKANESLSGDTGCSSKRPCRRSSESRVYDAVCIFVTRSNFKRAPGHMKSLRKLYN